MAADDEASGWTVRRLATHGTDVLAVTGAVFGGEPVAVTAGNDGQVCFWSLTDGTLRLSFQASRPDPPDLPHPTALAVLDDTLYTGWFDGVLETFDLSTGLKVDPQALGPETPVSALTAFKRPSGVQVWVAAWTDGTVVAMDGSLRAGGEPVWSLDAADESDLHTVAYAGVGEGEVQRWAIDEGVEELEPLRFGWSGDSEIRVATLGRRPLVLATDGHDVVTLDPRTGDTLSRRNPGVGRLTALHALDGTSATVGGTLGWVAVMSWTGTPDQLVEVGESVTALGSIGDTVIVGGADGGVYLVEPASAVVSDRVELQDDVPGETLGDDRLRRSPLAEALAVRLERRHEEGREKSFLVHLDGPWGSGKTTVLNFVANQLGDDWTIVRYNAWRQFRVGPPWWTLLTALRTEVLRRRRFPGRVSLWFQEMVQQRIRRASGLPATLLILLVAVGVFVLLRPGDLADTLTTVQGGAAALTAVATLFAGAQFVAGFFGWHSARGAKAFQDLDANPMDRVADHFSWLVEQEKRPIAYFVDDLDRCPAADVVELLEAVQTLVRDAGDRDHDDGVLSPCFVVAGDGAWIRQAFEEHYAEFAGQIAEPGRPLGYLFLAKIFQLTMPVPRIGPVRQAEFFRELLGLQNPDADPAATAAIVEDARRQVATAPNDDAQQQVLADLPQDVREVVAPAAVRRQTEPAFATATEHRLTGFAELLPDNPRAVKRFLNAFALTRSVRTVEGQAIPTACLALWTILQTRWPLLADALTAHPEWVDPGAATRTQVPDDVQALLDEPAVQQVLGFADGGPLTPELVRACRGG